MRAENRLHESLARPAPQPVRTPPPPPEHDEDEIDLRELLATVYEGRWLIAAMVAAAATLGALYAFTATPIYRADALVQVEEKGSGSDPLKDLSAMFTGETPAEAEIEIIRSRSVVAQVVEQLRLDLEVRPRRAPLFGGFLARRHKGEAPAEPWLWLSSYGWGGEQVELQKLELPREWENVELTLVAEAASGFRLLDPEGNELLRGTAGSEAAASGVALHVSKLVARPGTEFSVKKLPFIDAIADLQEQLGVKEKGKNTGVIQLELQGPDKERVRASLDALMEAYVRQNIERKAAEAEKTLQFVNGQLPVLKGSLEESELKLKQYRATTGRLDLGMEAQALVDRAAEIEKQLTTLELEKSELLQRYTQAHPSVVALQKKVAGLQHERRLLETRVRSLPETELESVRLARDVKVSTELYVLLLTRAQELGVVKSGTIGNVRVVDAAVTHPKPVSPRKGGALALSVLLGMAGGLGLTFLRKSLSRGVEDPDALEKALGISVYASVPHSEKQAEMVKQAARRKDALRPLALADPSDLAIESLRSLRTSLQFSLATAPNNVVMIGGSRPGVGKSFVSVNLAHVLADAGKKVLLVDADLRKGQLHRTFQVERGGGLSELITGGELEALVHKTESPNLHFLSTGTLPPNPSELLASEAFADAIARAQETYELVLVDVPPVLAVTDAAVIARVAGVNLMVVKSGLHPVRELSVAVARMEQSGARPNGFVFNSVPLAGRLYGYGKYGYHYQYDYR